MFAKTQHYSLDYGSIFNALPGLNLIISPNLHIIDANLNYLQTSQHQRTNLIGQHFSVLCEYPDPARKEKALAQWQESLTYVLMHKKPHTMLPQEFIFSKTLNNNLENKYWRLTNLPVLNQDGEILYILHEAQNITKEYLIEKEAREKQELYQTVSMATNDAIWDWNLQDNTIQWNDSYKSLFGYANPDPSISSWFDYIHPDDRNRVTSSIEQIIAQGSRFWSDEYRFRCADGSYSDVMDRGYVIYDTDGKPKRVVGSMQDITLKNQTEKRIQDDANFFRFLADSIPAFIWTSKPDGTTDYRNKYYLDFVGPELAQNPLFHWSKLLPPDEKEQLAQEWKQSLAEGKAFEKQFKIFSASGEYRWVLAKVHPKLNQAGEIIKWLGTATDIHAQKQTQLELEASIKSFKFLANTVPAFIWTSLPSGITDYRNQHYYDYIGLNVEDELNFDWLEPIHPDDREKSITLWEESARTGKTWEIEHRLKSHTGEYRWILSRAQPMLDNKGRVIKWFGISTDINTQKQKEEEIIERDALLQRMLSDAPILFFVLRGPELTCTFTNPNFNKLYNNRNFIGLTARQAWPELNQQGLIHIVEEVYKTGVPFVRNEYPLNYDRYGNKQLEFGYFNVVVQPLLDGQEQIEGILCFAVEVTAQVLTRHEAEKLALALRYETEKFKFLAEAVPQLVWLSKPDGTVDYFNKQWFEYTGMNPQETTDFDWQVIIHPADLESTITGWSKAVETSSPYEMEYRLRRFDGSFRWHLGRALPMRNAQNEILMWVGSNTDIHENKLAQQTLLETNLELRKINDDLDRFVYTASHDLKLPIINMGSIFSELMRSSEFKDPDNELLVQMFHKSLNQIHATITDLSEIAKVQKNAQEDIQEINLNELTEEVKFSVQEMIKNADARIYVDFSEVSTLRFSRANLRSIFYNLISNSLKYRSPDRVPEIKIKVTKNKDYAVLSIKDNGLGINLDRHRDKVFQMFKRFHNHVSGTGLGLYIINRIMQNNNGYVEVDSKVNEGTIFTIYFKLA